MRKRPPRDNDDPVIEGSGRFARIKRGPNGWVNFSMNAGVILTALVFMWQVSKSQTASVHAVATDTYDRCPARLGFDEVRSQGEDNREEVRVLNETVVPALVEVKEGLSLLHDEVDDLQLEVARASALLQVLVNGGG